MRLYEAIALVYCFAMIKEGQAHAQGAGAGCKSEPNRAGFHWSQAATTRQSSIAAVTAAVSVRAAERNDALVKGVRCQQLHAQNVGRVEGADLLQD